MFCLRPQPIDQTAQSTCTQPDIGERQGHVPRNNGCEPSKLFWYVGKKLHACIYLDTSCHRSPRAGTEAWPRGHKCFRKSSASPAAVSIWTSSRGGGKGSWFHRIIVWSWLWWHFCGNRIMGPHLQLCSSQPSHECPKSWRVGPRLFCFHYVLPCSRLIWQYWVFDV